MNELEAVENWIHDVMVADSAFNSVVSNRWWKYAAKQNAIDDGIYGIYQLQDADDMQGLGDVRLVARPLYLAKLIKRGFPDSNFKSALNRLDEILGRTIRATAVNYSSTVTYIISSRRVRPISYIERDAQQNPIFHVGGLYRLEVSVA